MQCWNATEAARRAGYQGNDNTLGSVGWENLQKPAIADRIKQRLAESAMSADEVLSRLAEQARGEGNQYLAEDGKLDFAQLIADGKGHLIKAIRPTKNGNVIEFYNAQGALQWLGKYHGLFTERVDVTTGGERVKGYTVLAHPGMWPGDDNESDNEK